MSTREMDWSTFHQAAEQGVFVRWSGGMIEQLSIRPNRSDLVAARKRTEADKDDALATRYEVEATELERKERGPITTREQTRIANLSELSPATVRRAYRRRPIHATTWCRIASAANKLGLPSPDEVPGKIRRS